MKLNCYTIEFSENIAGFRRFDMQQLLYYRCKKQYSNIWILLTFKLNIYSFLFQLVLLLFYVYCNCNCSLTFTVIQIYDGDDDDGNNR